MGNTSLEDFCGSTFWDHNLTWTTDNPDLTSCFEQTILTWSPSLFLILFLPLDLYITFSSNNKDIPYSWKNLSKLIVNGVLILLCIVDFIYVLIRQSHEALVYNVHIYTPIIKFVTFSTCLVLVLCHKKWGQVSSGLLCTYWFILSILGIPQFRTDLNNYQNYDLELPLITVTYMMSYCLCVLMFILNFFADNPPQRSQYKSPQNQCPESMCSLPCRLTYSWFDKLAFLGVKRPLVTSDLWQLNPSEQSKVISPQFDIHWETAVAKLSQARSEDAQYSKTNNTDRQGMNDKTKEQQVSFVWPLCKTFGPAFLVGSALRMVENILKYTAPQLLGLLILFVESDEPAWRGYFYAVLLFFVTCLQSFALSQYYQRMFLVGLRIRTCMMSAIYRKALTISSASRKESATGEIVNLMSVDTQRFMDLMNEINMIWSIPVEIGLAMYFLWQLLGPSVLAGVAVLIMTIPLGGIVGKKVGSFQGDLMKTKDERVNLVNEVLSGMKVLKLYAWEQSFEQLVTYIRDKEVKLLKSIIYWSSPFTLTWSLTPFVVGFVTFAVFISVDENNVLDAQIAFVSFSLLNMIRSPLTAAPVLFSEIIQAIVSVKRVNKFLNLEDLDPDQVVHDKNEADPLVMEKCSFSWDNESGVILKDISLRVKTGSLVAVVGAVGSGKSSILSAFLGEMDKTSGKVHSKGSIAYVPQIAWIQNATLKDNILYGKKMTDDRYRKVINACALEPDLEMLPGGDETEIGEKGINLSGGQKQRVSLARAVYHDADIYLLDDPLSAVDSHVGKHIFEEVIGPTGVLRKKTRLLVTHGIKYLPEVDRIVVLKDGVISETGTYLELIESKGAFSEFLNTYNQEDQPSDDEDTRAIGDSPENRSRLKSVSSETGSFDSLKRRKSTESSLYEDDKVRSKKSAAKTGEKLTEEEVAEVGSVSFGVYKNYFLAAGYKYCIVSIIMFIIFQSLVSFSNIWLSIWTSDPDVFLNGTHHVAKQNMYLGVYGAIGLLQGVAALFTNLVPFLGCWTAGAVLHAQLVHAIFRSPMSFFDTTPTGRILSRFSKDIQVLDSLIPLNLVLAVWFLSYIIGTLFVISYSTPIFLVVVIPVALIYHYIKKFYISAARQLSRLESISRSPIFSHFGESVSGAHCIRAYKSQERFIKESEKKVDNNAMCHYPNLIAQRWLGIRLEFIGNLIILFSALFAVRARDWISPGIVGLSVSYSLQITHLLNWLVRFSSEVENNIVAAERIKEYADNKLEAPWEVEGKKVSSDWPERGEVEFKDFQVRYREGLECVLKGISFCIRGGEKVGVVGRTGAGKSSLTLSLFRIIESASGSILIDGLDISKLGLHTLRSRLTIIPQDPILFSGSLRMNLDPFEKHNDEQIWTALEHAHLKDFTKGLESGLQFHVSEGGENLSVGQRQLICLARALLRKTKVLILDEATAAVDLETDDLIQKTIRTEFAHCTVITIAHRINTIMDSDKVIVLDKGLVTEFDSPNQLLASKNSMFYSMAHDAGLV